MTDPSKTCAIVQSNYLPWRGYFDLIRSADVFVLLDVVQYTKNDWRNRNRIMTRSGPHWLTVPVSYSFSARPAIDEVAVSDTRWAQKHIKTLQQAYARAPAFAHTAEFLFPQLRALGAEPRLSAINQSLIQAISTRLGLATPIRPAPDLLGRDRLIALDPNDRLIAICEAAGAGRYLSGPAAKSYLDEARFRAAGIAVDWMAYPDYPPYPQTGPAYDGHLSIVDLLFNTGPEAAAYL